MSLRALTTLFAQKSWANAELFTAIAAMAARIKVRPVAGSRDLVVTPWSGRSPAGWSA